jgi:hypothetical protein
VSADANNALTLGSDNLVFYNPATANAPVSATIRTYDDLRLLAAGTPTVVAHGTAGSVVVEHNA